MAGQFISLEGGEGVGKSLFASNLAAVLTHNSIPFIKSYEPGGTPAADRLRSFFLTPIPEDPLLPETELFLVSAARTQHIGRKLKPALDEGKWVLCDRFADSSRVYQGIMPGLPSDYVDAVIAASTQGFQPHLTFLIDCDTDVALSRVEKRAEQSRFDTAARDYHEGLRRAYLQVAKRFPERIVVLDGAQTPEKVLKDAVAVIGQRLGWNLAIPT